MGSAKVGTPRGFPTFFPESWSRSHSPKGVRHVCFRKCGRSCGVRIGGVHQRCLLTGFPKLGPPMLASKWGSPKWCLASVISQGGSEKGSPSGVDQSAAPQVGLPKEVPKLLSQMVVPSGVPPSWSQRFSPWGARSGFPRWSHKCGPPSVFSHVGPHGGSQSGVAQLSPICGPG